MKLSASLFMLVLLMATAAHAVNACLTNQSDCATSWTSGVDGTSPKAGTLDGAEEAYWAFNSAGESPFLRSLCRETIFVMIGTGDLHGYVCTTNDFPTNCIRIEGIDMDAGSFGVTVTNDANRQLLGSPYRRFLFQVQSGSPSGHLYAICAGGL